MRLSMINEHWATLKNYPNSLVDGDTAIHSSFVNPFDRDETPAMSGSNVPSRSSRFKGEQRKAQKKFGARPFAKI